MMKIALLGVLLMTVALPVLAGENDSWKFEGTFYFDYFADLTDRPDDDPAVTRGFEFRRVYATAKKSWGDMGFRYTSDIDYKFETGNLNVYTKYAYLEHKGLIPHAKVLVGLHSPKTNGWVEDVWHYRSMAKTLSDENKWTNSAEFGVGVQGKAYDGMVEYYLDFSNGNGYKDPVEKDGVGFSARGVVKPAEGVVLSGLFTSNTPGGFEVLQVAGQDSSVALDSGNLYFEGLAGYENDRFGVFAQYGMFTDKNLPAVNENDEIVQQDVDQTGLSLFGRALVTEGTYAVARFDMVDPNTDVDNDGHNWFLVGLDYELHEGFYLQPSFRVTSYEADGVDSEQEIVLTFYGDI